MTPAAILRRLAEIGVTATTDGERIHLRGGNTRLPDELRETIRQHKSDIMRWLALPRIEFPVYPPVICAACGEEIPEGTRPGPAWIGGALFHATSPCLPAGWRFDASTGTITRW